MDLAPSTIAGRYRIIRELGRGGMGVVYEAHHINTGESLALKVLLSHTGAQADMIERFKREMRASALIRSEHVVRITDADAAPELTGALFLVMELLDGFDLEHILRRRGPFSAVEVIWLLTQVARGLDKAHAVGIVHRDLKPENLFLHCKENNSLIVKLLDFGIARLVEPGRLTATEAKLTKHGAILGTPAYLSPEQAMGDADKLGPHTDVWSVGLIAYELLSGQTYFQADSVARMVGQICFAVMPAPSQRAASLAPGFDRWFELSCARDPAKRWESVGIQVAALADALGLTDRAAQGEECPASLKAWFYSQRVMDEATVLDGKNLAPVRTHVPGRTTTSEGRGQSTTKGFPRRLTMAVFGGVAVVGFLAVVAMLAILGPAKRRLNSTPAAARPARAQLLTPDAGVSRADLTTQAQTPSGAAEANTMHSAVGEAGPKLSDEKLLKKKRTPPSVYSPTKKQTGVTGYDPPLP